MDEIMAKDLNRAKFVKKARQERAWTQSRLALIAGVTLRTIQRLEKDGAASFETLLGIAGAFEIDVKELSSISSSKDKEMPVLQKKVHLMPRLASGKGLTDVVLGSDQFQFEHDEDNDPRSIAAMKGILKLLQQDVVRLYDADPIKRLDVESELSQEIQGLEKFGYYLFGIKREIPRINKKEKTQISMCTIYMSHSRSPKIVRDKKQNMMIPAVLTEVAQ